MTSISYTPEQTSSITLSIALALTGAITPSISSSGSARLYPQAIYRQVERPAASSLMPEFVILDPEDSNNSDDASIVDIDVLDSYVPARPIQSWNVNVGSVHYAEGKMAPVDINEDELFYDS